MSSILYVEVLAIEENCLTCQLAAIQTYEDFVESPTLAVQLILESWSAMWRGWLSDAVQASGSGGLYCPFPPQEAITRASVSPIRQHMPQEEDSILVADEEFVQQLAKSIIRSTRVLERRHCGRPFRHRYAPRPECLFEIQVTDTAWIAHLAPGVCWDTTAYPYEAGW